MVLRQLLALAAFVGVCVPAAASAYSLVYTFPAGTVSCDSSGIYNIVAGSASYSLPARSPNIIAFTTINGIRQGDLFGTYGPPYDDTIAAGGVALLLATPATPPYTASQQIFPFDGVSAVGTGVEINGTCAADGSATLVTRSGIAAPAPAAVPILPPTLVIVLAALLGLTTWSMSTRCWPAARRRP